jgi:DNA-binding transcriptional ArsR family regulator
VVRIDHVSSLSTPDSGLDIILVSSKMSFMSSPIAAITSPRRREILRLVWATERSAGEIHRALADVTFGAVSQHLRALDAGGLVAMRRDGRRRLYRARREALGPVATILEALWSDALYRLTLHAELEASRRGPHRQRRRRRRRTGGHS